MKIRNVQMIDVNEWDGLVEQTYGRPYSFQQQDGCKQRGTFNLTVPDGDSDRQKSQLCACHGLAQPYSPESSVQMPDTV